MSPATFDRDGIAQSQHTVAATPLTINGALGATLDYGRIVGIYSSADLHLIGFTIVGTNANGEVISETVATGPNNSTVVSTKLYKTVTSVTPDTTDGSNNVEVGTVATTLSAESKIVPLNSYSNVAATVAVYVTGTINFTVQETFTDPQIGGASVCNWTIVTALASKTASTVSQISAHAKAVKIQINSYSASATVVANITPSGTTK